MRNFALLIVLFLLVSVILSNRASKVNADSPDSMSFTSGVVLYSPVNTTYSSKFLTLNLTAGVGLGINCTINYNIDNKHQGNVPWVPLQPDELHVINKVAGTVALPELTEGTHNITIQVVCTLNSPSGVTISRYLFIPECSNITDYTATWTDIIHFTINTQKTNTIPDSEGNWVEVDRFTGGSWTGGTRPFTVYHNEWRLKWTYEPIDEETTILFRYYLLDVETNIVEFVVSDEKTSGTANFFQLGEFHLFIVAYNVQNYSIIVEENIDSIPEFPSWIILPIFAVATLAALVIKKKTFHQFGN